MVGVSARWVLIGAAVVGAIAAMPLALASTVTVAGGLDFDRVEDSSHAVAAALVVATLVLVQPDPHSSRARWWAAVIALVAAALVEAGQGLTPGRTPSWADLAYDVVGVAFGVAALGRAQRHFGADRLRWITAAVLAVVGIGTLAFVN